MKFPTGSVIHKEEPIIESNAKLLEEHLKKIDWRIIAKALVIGWFVILSCVFSMIVTVRLAMSLF